MSYLDYFIPDRIRIIKEDKDPIHIYELLNKHFGNGIDKLKSIYTISVDTLRREITIKGGLTDIYNLNDFLVKKDVKFLSRGQINIILQLEDFIKKVY